jgi:hypothetical protein
VHADGVVEPLDGVKHVCPRFVPRPVDLAPDPLGLSDEKKLSMAAWAQTLSDRLRKKATPLSAIGIWHCSQGIG